MENEKSENLDGIIKDNQLIMFDDDPFFPQMHDHGFEKNTYSSQSDLDITPLLRFAREEQEKNSKLNFWD